jgi:lipid A oxidase
VDKIARLDRCFIFWLLKGIEMRLKNSLLVIAAISGMQAASAQNQEISFYGGIQESPHSTVKHDGNSFGAGWKGKSLTAPIYYGLRYTRWSDNQTGWSINFAHAKAYADDKALAKNGGYRTLEFTDGSNPITVNYLWKFDPVYSFNPYVGLGAGISIPYVEIRKQSEEKKDKNWGFQYGGPVLRFSAGVSRPINEQWNWFVEYDFHYLMLNVKHNEGRLKTNLIHNALNLGVGYRF